MANAGPAVGCCGTRRVGRAAGRCRWVARVQAVLQVASEAGCDGRSEIWHFLGAVVGAEVVGAICSSPDQGGGRSRLVEVPGA